MACLGTKVPRRRHRNQLGFTLIELLVVIAVLAILAAIVLFNVIGVTNRGQVTGCTTDVKTVQSAVDAYMGDHGTGGLVGGSMSGTDFTELISGGYLHDIPSLCTMTLSADATHGGFGVTTP